MRQPDISFFVCLFLSLIILAPIARAATPEERRVALVIGNSAYKFTTPLPNPTSDARAMAAVLKATGFEVVAGYDLDKRAAEQKIRVFAEKLEGADVGLFFYAGHGLQVNNTNYLVPIDARLTTAAALDFEMTRLDLVQRSMEHTAQTNLIFLDACRDNPLARNLARALGARARSAAGSPEIGRGLAKIEAGVGTLISFSTQPGNVALDGEGGNSPYAAALVDELTRAPRDLSDTLIAVRRRVINETRGQQVPWEHSSLTSRFSFAAKTAAAGPQVATAAPRDGALTFEQRAELEFWRSVKDTGNPEALRSYRARYPAGTFAGLAEVMIKQLEATSGKPLESDVKTASLPKPAQETVADGRGESETPAPPALSERDLVLAIQRELERVGCDPGPIDGAWGRRTGAALGAFRREADLGDIDADAPSAEAHAAIAARSGRVCPESCQSGYRLRHGTCVAEAAAPSQRESSRSSPTATPRGRSAPAAKPDKPGICMSIRNRIVPCKDPEAAYRLN